MHFGPELETIDLNSIRSYQFHDKPQAGPLSMPWLAKTDCPPFESDCMEAARLKGILLMDL